MTSPDKRTVEIASAFTSYLESEDVSLIEHFAREDIEIALLQLIRDGEAPYYVAMQKRREELKEGEDQKRAQRTESKNRIAVLIIGMFLGFILLFLKLIFL